MPNTIINQSFQSSIDVNVTEKEEIKVIEKEKEEIEKENN